MSESLSRSCGADCPNHKDCTTRTLLEAVERECGISVSVEQCDYRASAAPVYTPPVTWTYNPCDGCQHNGVPYWSIISPCTNCPRKYRVTYTVSGGTHGDTSSG